MRRHGTIVTVLTLAKAVMEFCSFHGPYINFVSFFYDRDL